MISQHDIDNKCGVFHISKSGNYNLKCNLSGQIVILANNVCLDLCCFQLDGKGADYALSVNGSNVRVSNGSIVNYKKLGIKAENVTDLKLEDLVINHVDRAISLQNVKNSEFINLAMDGITNEHDVIFAVRKSEGLSFSKISISNSVKAFGAGFSALDSALWLFDESSEVKIDEGNLSSNVSNANDPEIGFQGFTMLYINKSNNFSVRNVSLDKNSLTRDWLIGVQVRDSNNVVHEKCTSNSCTVVDDDPIGSGVLTGFLVYFSKNMVYRHCQSNSCTIKYGFTLNFNAYGSKGLIYDHCESNDNGSVIGAGGIGFYTDDRGLTSPPIPDPPVELWSDQTFITHCTSNDCYGTQQAGGLIIIGSAFVQDSQFNGHYCTGNPTTAYNAEPGAYGILIIGDNQDAVPPNPLRPGDTTIIERTVCSQIECKKWRSAGFWLGDATTIDGSPKWHPGQKLVLRDCTANFIVSEEHSANGYFMTTCDNSTFENCIAMNIESRSADASKRSTGFDVQGNYFSQGTTTKNYKFKGCKVSDIRATDAANVGGYWLSDVTDSVILDSEALSSTKNAGRADGIRVDGASVRNIVRDSVVINNADGGVYTVAATNASVLGCQADSNGTDYDGVPAGSIETFTKATGVISGTPNRYTNLSLV